MLRIGVVLGRSGGMMKKLLPLFKLGMGGPVGSGNQWLPWIHVEDLVSMMLFALKTPKVHGPVNGVSGRPVTNGEFSTALGKALHRPAFLPAPAFAIKLAMGELSDLVLGSTKVLPKAVLAEGFTFTYPDLQSALEEIVQKKKSEAALHRFVAEQIIPRPVEEVFPFFCNVKNLETITPDWLHFRVVGKMEGDINAGTLINYKLRIRGIPVRWQSKIELWEKNRKFVDTQTKGPYKLWHHTHEFFPEGSSTRMRDTVLYEVPGGTLGNALLSRWIEKDVKTIFEFRKKKIETLFK